MAGLGENIYQSQPPTKAVLWAGAELPILENLIKALVMFNTHDWNYEKPY